MLGTEIFVRFEVDASVWRKILKWSLLIALTLGFSRVIGHWASVVAVALALLGFTFRVTWCRRNGIHPLKVTLRRRYYELRGWDREDG